MPFETTEPPFTFHRGTRPLLVSMPHVGTHVPAALSARLTPQARALHDTDWHLGRLYAFAVDMGASVLQATHSRYVIDLNRPPDGASLYPGQSVTGLCPTDMFDSTPLYADGTVPTEAEVAARREAIWQPYHAQLTSELARLRAAHGVAVLWDAHSIRSVVPRFSRAACPTSTSAPPTVPAAPQPWRTGCWPLHRPNRGTPPCSMAASRAGTSPATTATLPKTCTPCSWK